MSLKLRSLAENRPAPEGFQKGRNGNKSIAIRMEPSMFYRVHRHSVNLRTSFAEAARDLIGKGLENAG